MTLKPRPGALEIFRDLQRAGVVQAVVSNSDRLIVDANLGAVGLVEPGMKSVSRNDVREGKPLPEPFLRAAWLTGIDPAETFVMEDSFHRRHGRAGGRHEDHLLAGKADGRPAQCAGRRNRRRRATAARPGLSSAERRARAGG